MNVIHIPQFYSTTLEEFIFASKIIEHFFPDKKEKKANASLHLYLGHNIHSWHVESQGVIPIITLEPTESLHTDS